MYVDDSATASFKGLAPVRVSYVLRFKERILRSGRIWSESGIRAIPTIKSPLTIKSPPSPAESKIRLFLKNFEKNEKFLGPKGREFFFTLKLAKTSKNEVKMSKIFSRAEGARKFFGVFWSILTIKSPPYN